MPALEGLGEWRALSGTERSAGTAALLVALLLTALLERLQFSMRSLEGSRWWASNGRDVLNFVALTALGLALLELGFSPPVALAVAGTMVIAMSVLQGALDRFPRLSLALSVGLALGLGAPVLASPRGVHAFFRSALHWLW